MILKAIILITVLTEEKNHTQIYCLHVKHSVGIQSNYETLFVIVNYELIKYVISHMGVHWRYM